MLDGTDVLYLVRRTPNTPLASNIRVGSRLPAHATTMGRMLLAFMPPVEIERLYAGKELQRFSDHTATTLQALQAKAEQDRRAGIAWSEAHFERGIGSAAVAVFDFAGTPLGAINVSGPVGAFADEERRALIGKNCAAAGAEISAPSRLDRRRCRPSPAAESSGRRADRMDLGLAGQGRGRHRRDVRASGSPPRGCFSPKAPRSRSAGATRRGSRRPNRALLGNAPDDELLAMRCNVLDKDAVAAFAAAVERWKGRCDILVNNAGQARMSTFADTTDEAWREELELKFFSQIYPVRAFKPLLDKSDAAAILAVNSLLAYQPEPYMVATAAARAGAQSLVKSLAREFAPRIRVNSVMLGLIDSGQWQRRFECAGPTARRRASLVAEIARTRHIPLERLGEPDEVARAIAFLCSPAAGFITGAQLEISGGISRSHVRMSR